MDKLKGCKPSVATHCNLPRLACQRVRVVIVVVLVLILVIVIVLILVLVLISWPSTPYAGHTQSSQPWWASPSWRMEGLEWTWEIRIYSTDPEYSRYLWVMGHGSLSHQDIVNSNFVQRTGVFKLFFGFRGILYMNIVHGSKVWKDNLKSSYLIFRMEMLTRVYFQHISLKLKISENCA